MLAAVHAAAPRRLFIAANGPRRGRPGDVERCRRTRALFDNITWPCELHTLYRDRNIGCKAGMETAITWFFSHVESGIVLEDDCVPTAGFFRFCADLLDRYRDSREVMMVGGYNPWDFAWAFAILTWKGLAAMPTSNLVASIGFDDEATHTRMPWPHELDVPTREIAFPLTHPASVVADEGYEAQLCRRRLGAGTPVGQS